MVQISLIPVIGVLALMVLLIFVSNRLAHRVAGIRGEVERRRKVILRDDGRLDERLVEDLLKGIGTDHAVTHFVSERAKLLPGANPEAPALWSIDQLEQAMKEERTEGIEQVKRRLFAPALAVAVAIVAVCMITAAVLYQFHSGPLPAADDTYATSQTSVP